MNRKHHAEPMRILHIVDGLRVGGAEKLIVTFARELRYFPADLTVVTLQKDTPGMVRAVAETGANVVPFHSRKLIHPGRFLHLWRYVSQKQFTVIHTHLTAANILGGVIGRLTQTPVFTTLHNTKLFSQTHLYHGRLEDWVLKNLTGCVIGVGQEVADLHQQRLGLDDVVVLPNAVSIPEPLPAKRRAEIRVQLVDDPESVILLAIGRLEPQKGFADLLRAFARLNETAPNARLLIAGKGPERDSLLAEIGRLGLEKRASLMGVREDIPELLAAADLFVSASHWEGLPVSLLEAMAAKKPCVVTAVGDVPQLIDEHTGVLLPPGQPKKMAAALAKLLAEPASWPVYGDAAYRKICGEYSADAWVQRQLALYAEAANVPVPRPEIVQ